MPVSYEDLSLAMLERGLRDVPAYRPWRRFDPGPSKSVEERYRSLPVTTKRDLRAWFPHGFVPRGLDLDRGLASGEVSFVHTSGTTDDRVTLLWHQGWWDESERQSWRLNSHAARVATGDHREVVLASPFCVGPPPGRRRLPQEERRMGRLLFVNQIPDTSLWTDAVVGRMAAEINSYKPAVIEGDPPYLAAFAHTASRMGLRVWRPEVIILTYSYPSLAHLRWIRGFFRRPVFSSHGSTEAGYVFMQCEEGRFHQNTMGCRVDVRRWKRKFGGPALGTMVVTPFGHPWFSVLRFHLGDVVRLSRAPCPCGRKDGLTADSIEGRARDISLTTAGMPVTVAMLDSAVGSVKGILTYQLNQHRDGRIVLNVVPDGTGDRAAMRKRITETVAGLYGPGAAVSVRFVKSVKPEPSGKYRLARSSVPIDADSFAERRGRT